MGVNGLLNNRVMWKYEKIGRLIGNNRVELGETENGYCYKDEEAYESGNGIAYIPEHGLIEDSSDKFELSYTRTDIENVVRNHLKAIDSYKNEEQVRNLSLSVFQILDWQCVATLLSDLDLDEYL